jgi:hypothetical protein
VESHVIGGKMMSAGRLAGGLIDPAGLKSPFIPKLQIFLHFPDMQQQGK